MSVADNYQLEQSLGRTPRASAHRARRKHDGARVLITVLRAESTRISDLARIKHQYDRIRRIDSSRIVPILGIEEQPEGLVIVFEDPGARPLDALLGPGHPVDKSRFLELAIPIAEAVRDVHRHEIIHGNINPTSILEGDGNRVLLWRFAADFAVTHDDEAIYSRAVLSERLPYISPEQTGRMNRGVDRRADLYSLGVVFYQMLTGQRPFQADDPLELIHAHIAVLAAPPSQVVPSVPRPLGDIVMKLLAKNAEDRYQTAEGLIADLSECRRRLEQEGQIGAFEVGLRDRAELFQIHQKLYGREEAIGKLIATFEAVMGGARRIVLVSGYSGIGKSSLVQEILKPLAREKGYYISGKYDQYSRDTPYSALIQAFDTLVRQILSESGERVERWRSELQEALGSNGQVICEVIPALRHLIDPPPVPAFGPTEAQNRFILTFQKFVAVFARPAHPLALFLDDLQWIDAASLGLVQALLASTELERLFFCGAYRDNEVTAAHPFIVMRGELEKGGGGLAAVDIVLSPLGKSHVMDLIRDSLGRADVEPLAELVLKKTGGNPFFIKSFLKSLHDRKALTFSPAAGWRWDIEAITRLGYTDNVVELMANDIGRLPAETQKALMLMSVIGNRIDLGLLSWVIERSVGEVYGQIEPALDEGLILQAGEYYRFAHDKIQEAAYALIPSGETAAIHHRIGTLLSDKLTTQDSRTFFSVVDHLNRAGALVHGEARIELALMNLRAAERAEDSAAFTAALRYLENGLGRLPQDCWKVQHDLTFRISTKKSVVESLLGRHGDALVTLADCFANARNRIEKVRVRRLRMSVLIMQNDLRAALDEGLDALRSFDIDLPAFPDDATFEAETMATLALLDGRSIDELCSLPFLDDPEIDELQNIMEEMLSPCYFLNTNNFGITVAKIVQNTLRFGISKASIYGYVNFGMFLCVSGRIEEGYRLGQIANRVGEIHHDKKSESMLCNMWGAFIQHWKEPYDDYKQSFIKGVRAGLETGQYVWAFYNATNIPTSSLLAGMPLYAVIAEANSYQAVCKLDQSGAFTWLIRAAGQLAQHLSVAVSIPDRLAGEWLDLDAVIHQARATKSRAALFFTDIFVVLLNLFRGAYKEAARVALEAEPDLPAVASWHMTPSFHFYAGIALTRAATASPDPVLRSRYCDKARSFAGKLARWEGHCPDKLRHRRLLLAAELARLDGQSSQAGQLYNEGIARAHEGHFVQDAALGCELGALYFLELGNSTIGRAYLREAHALYSRWGALEVARRLERIHPDTLLTEPAVSRPEAAPPAKGLDLRSAIKASQAISGEIVLPRLLEKLMWIILENAGARRGFVILKGQDGLTLDVMGDVEQARVDLLPSIALESRSDLSTHAVHLVARTRESLIVDDTRKEPALAGDPYIQHSPAQSILAAPIAHQGRLLGVIYLENNLTTSAFPRDRIELLTLLSAQIAVAIENAHLFSQREQVVATRTAELRDATEQITALHAAREREQEQQLREKTALIARQNELIHTLSAPIIHVWDDVLTVPLVGALDDQRAASIMHSLLEAIVASRSRFAIIDLTGVDSLDTRAADHIVRIARAVALLGTRAILTGLRPTVAVVITTLSIDTRGLSTYATLRDGLKFCMHALRTDRR